MDIMANPKAGAVLQNIMKEKLAIFTQPQEEGSASSEAISDEMGLAMMQYMPLRGMISFGGVTHEQIAQLLAAINS